MIDALSITSLVNFVPERMFERMRWSQRGVQSGAVQSIILQEMGGAASLCAPFLGP
jgi:hypothetical protein